MTGIIQITIAAALILSIILPFGAFLSVNQIFKAE